VARGPAARAAASTPAQHLARGPAAHAARRWRATPPVAHAAAPTPAAYSARFDPAVYAARNWRLRDSSTEPSIGMSPATFTIAVSASRAT
jgi:hypothetical protein